MPEEQKPKEEFVSLRDILNRPKFEELKKTVPISAPTVSMPHATRPIKASPENIQNIHLEQKKSEPHTSDPLTIIATLIDHCAQTLQEAVALLKQVSLEATTNTQISETKKIFTTNSSPSHGTKIQGVFNGTSMYIGLQKYFISSSSIQRLSLRNGDILELTITKTGAFWYTKK